MRQVCNRLGLCIGQLEQEAWSILKKEGMTSHTSNHLEVATKKWPKSIMQSCLCTWSNAYGGRSVRRAANDGVVFSTVSDDKDEPVKRYREPLVW